MSIAWRIEGIGTDRYRFFNFSGRPAEQVTIEDPGSGDPISIGGPVDCVLGTNSVDQDLTPGQYRLSWDPAGDSSGTRLSVPFSVPVTGPGTALWEPSTAAAVQPMHRDRLLLGFVAAAVAVAGFFALYWPTSLDDYDQWGFRIACGSGFSQDLAQAATADHGGDAANPAAHATRPDTDYAGQCQSAIWFRRAWAFPLLIIGAALLIAIMVTQPRGSPAETPLTEDRR